MDPSVPIQASNSQNTTSVPPSQQSNNTAHDNHVVIDNTISSNQQKTVVIIFILVLLILLFGTGLVLIQFNIIKLGDTRTSTSAPQVESNQTVVLFDILLQEKNDKVGRTVFYKNRVFINDPASKNTEGIGWVTNPSVGSTGAKVALNARFEGTEDIPNSPDKYFKLVIPGDTSVYKVRILGENTDLELSSPSAYLKGTPIFVEDLNFLVRKTENRNVVGFLSSFSKNDLERIFQKNDALTIIFLRQDKTGVIFDNQDNPVAGSIYIRRFGGRQEIGSEILHPLFNQ